MSYCVHCGVKLADYHETCPLCNTRVMDPNMKIDPETREYPQYREYSKTRGTKHMKRRLVGTILSFVFSLYIVILLLVNFLVNHKLSWSLIPVLSLVYLWFTVAYPFLRSQYTFYRLYTFDSFATALYLFGLNFIISGSITWSKFASLGIIFVWIIMSGIFISERVKRWVPMIIYYVLASVLFATSFAFMLTNTSVILNLVLPLYLAVLFFTLLSFFEIKSMIFDIYNFFAILFINIALLSVVVDLTLSQFLDLDYALSWSLLVAAALIPLSLASYLMRNIKKMNTYLTKKFHR